MDRDLDNLGLTTLGAADACKVNGGVRMSATNYALLQQLLAVHDSIVALRQDRKALRAIKAVSP